MRGARALLLAAALAPSAGAAGGAQADVIGTWDIRVSGDTAHGDHGVIVIREAAGGLFGDMTFTDVSAAVTAVQGCEVAVAGDAVSVACLVLHPMFGYTPDDLHLRVAGPDRLVGRLVSSTTGAAELTRRAVPLS